MVKRSVTVEFKETAELLFVFLSKVFRLQNQQEHMRSRIRETPTCFTQAVMGSPGKQQVWSVDQDNFFPFQPSSLFYTLRFFLRLELIEVKTLCQDEVPH
ncbi:uncharacterized protein ACO6RY_05623 [Pungitius sinensis]